jgi:hypothetical protein
MLSVVTLIVLRRSESVVVAARRAGYDPAQ